MSLRLGLTIFLVVNSSLVFAGQALTIVHDAKDHILLEFNVANFGSYLTTNAGQKVALVTGEGMEINTERGAPAVPRLSEFISVPAGTKPRIKILAQTVKTQRLPAPVAPSHGLRNHCEPHVSNVDADVFAFTAGKTAATANVSEVNFLGPLAVALLSINPVQLTDDPLVIKTTTKLLLRIDFRAHKSRLRTPVNERGMDPASYKFFRDLVLNRAATPMFKITARAPVDLIITRREFLAALQPLLRLKSAQGRQVVIKTIDTPTSSSDDIKRLIREQYQSDAVPAHTLLVGDIEQIPAVLQENYWSDYAYTLLDEGAYPDLSIARLPARDHVELQNMIAKIVAREQTPRHNSAFLLTSGFETQWCQQNLKYIADNILAHSQIPLDLGRLYASEGARTARVIDAFNKNPNVVIYDGHGDSRGMTETPLIINHLGALKNTSYPLILSTACLNSYWPTQANLSARNFAETVLALKGAGAAGILAAAGNSSGHGLLQHILRAAIYDEQDFTEPHHHLNEIGQAVLYAKIKYLKQHHGSSKALSDNHMFYYHGDPSTTIFQHVE